MQPANSAMVAAMLRTPGKTSTSSGRNGDAVRRSCQISRPQPVSVAAARARPVTEVAAKRWPTKVTQTSVALIVNAKPSTPAVSKGGRVLGRTTVSGNCSTRHTASSVGGSKPQNSQRQPIPCTTQPPSTGPATLDSVKLAANQP